jgi:hypothetical protein
MTLYVHEECLNAFDPSIRKGPFPANRTILTVSLAPRFVVFIASQFELIGGDAKLTPNVVKNVRHLLGGKALTRDRAARPVNEKCVVMIWRKVMKSMGSERRT